MAIALRYAARSDLGLGPKSRNEDSGYAGPHLLVLADGMGGHAAGDVASSMIVGELAPLDDDSVPAEQAIPLLEDGLRRANAKMTRAMNENSELAGMGSTTIVMLRTGNKIAMAHIGDSRAFMLRGDSFSQITKDHSFVQQLLDEGRISRQEASSHPQRSVVTRVMTGQPEDEPDTSLREAKVGDRFLLCSDGLSDFVGADVIEEILRDADTAEQAADRCIEVALKAHTRDNVTVIVADVVDGDRGDMPSTVPQVVGAAAKRMGERTRPMPTSPAEKAAMLAREASGRLDAEEVTDELADDGERSRRTGLIWRGVALVATLAVLGAGAWVAYDWTQQQYFIADADGRVAIYRGVSQDLGPWSLSHVETNSDVVVAELPDDVQGSVRAAIPARDLTDAELKVDRLRSEAARCRLLALSGTPCGDTPVVEPTPTPTPTTPSPTTPQPTPSTTTTAPATAAPVDPAAPGTVLAAPVLAGAR